MPSSSFCAQAGPDHLKVAMHEVEWKSTRRAEVQQGYAAATDVEHAAPELRDQMDVSLQQLPLRDSQQGCARPVSRGLALALGLIDRHLRRHHPRENGLAGQRPHHRGSNHAHGKGSSQEMLGTIWYERPSLPARVLPRAQSSQ